VYHNTSGGMLLVASKLAFIGHYTGDTHDEDREKSSDQTDLKKEP
jgi:hypothetical protein